MSRGGPSDFAEFITPEKAKKICDRLVGAPHEPLAYWEKLAKLNGECLVCGQPIWKFGACGMCFPCTTGESDASEDYELI